MPSVQNQIPLNQYFSQLDMPDQNQTTQYQQKQQLKSTSTENYLRSAFNEKNIAMSNDRNFVKRGDLHGPIFDLDHLATFTVGSKQGLLKAEDGMRKLRIMEKSQGIWTMECQIVIDTNYLVVLDKKTGQEVEKFPLSLVYDPVSVVSDDKKDIYNNIILFTVLEDNKKKSTVTPSEMHIFQCNRSHSAEIVDEIYKAKEVSQPKQNGHHDHRDGNNNYSKNLKMASNIASSSHQMNSPQRRATFNNHNQMAPTRIEMEVQVLNHCFDDIERFVTRLQNSTEFYKELEKRQKHRKSHKKHLGDGMLGLRAQMPPPEHYIDIFQKFKHSLNLLAKLKAHIHDPNAPELVHFLFTPLSLIVNTTKEQPYRGLSKTVWNPLLTKDAKDLLLNCLTSKEQDLWLLLGDAWSVTVEDAQLHPQQYGHLENQVYNPVFSDGWTPNFSDEFSKIAFATAAQIQAQPIGKQPVPIQKQRYYSNTQPQFDEQQRSQYRIRDQYDSSAQPSSRYPNIRNYESMKKWAVDLCYRGAKIYEVTHDRQANNEKELTIKVGELLEVLDDKRNWWRLRNYQGEVGHAPVTILRPYEFNSTNSNPYLTSNPHSGHYDAEKFNQTYVQNNNKMANLQMTQLSPEDYSSSSSSFLSDNNLTNNIDKTHISSVLSPNVSNYLNSRTYLIKNSYRENDPIENKSSFNEDNHFNVSSESYRHMMQSKINNSSQMNSSNELSKNPIISSTQHSNSFDYSSNTSSENNQKTAMSIHQTTTTAGNIPTTPKASFTKNQILNQNFEKPLTFIDQIKQNPIRFLRKNSRELPVAKNSLCSVEVAPIKEQLHDEIVKRMSQKDIFAKKSEPKKSELFINSKSTVDEVKKFLISKDFSQKVVLMFSELTGEQIFMLEKSDFEMYCSKEEAAHLDSQIKVQKSLCGYNEKPTNELDNILKKRKEKSETHKP